MTTTEAILADGNHVKAIVTMRPNWSMTACVEDATLELQLQAVIPDTDNGLIFLYAPSEPQARYSPAVAASPLPANATELLLYAPTIALRKNDKGFCMLSWQVWKEFTQAPGREYGVLSSIAESCPLSAEEESGSESNSDSLGALSDVDGGALDEVEEEVEEDDDDDDDDGDDEL